MPSGRPAGWPRACRSVRMTRSARLTFSASGQLGGDPSAHVCLARACAAHGPSHLFVTVARRNQDRSRSRPRGRFRTTRESRPPPRARRSLLGAPSTVRSRGTRQDGGWLRGRAAPGCPRTRAPPGGPVNGRRPGAMTASPKRARNFLGGRRPGAQGLVHEGVGVDDRRSARRQFGHHHALAGADAAGHRDAQHVHSAPEPGLGRPHGIGEQHRNRQRTHAPRNRGDGARDACDGRVDVADHGSCRASRRPPASETPGKPQADLRFVSDRIDATSMTTAPGFTNSGVTNAGLPMAATRMSAVRATAGRSCVREWQIVTVAWRCKQQQRHRLADNVAAPDDDGAGRPRSRCRSDSAAR